MTTDECKTDQTRAEFEHEKTERMKALCDLLPQCDGNPDSHTLNGRKQVLGWLSDVISSRWGWE